MTTIVDDYSPIAVGDVGATFAPVFQHKDGSTVSLAGATLSLRMQDQYGDTKTGTGTWTIDDAVNGLAHYNYSSADVNQAGTWTLYTTITIAGLPLHGDPKLLVIYNVP